MAKELCFFDLDDTLLDGDSSSMWCHYMVAHGLVKDPEAFLKREQELVESYHAGTMQLQEYLDFATSPILSYPVSEIEKWVNDCVQTEMMPRLFPQARTLIDELLARDVGVVVISASSEIVVKPVGRALGLPEEHIISVCLERKDGFYLPIVKGIPSFREGKVTNVEMWLDVHPEYDRNFSFYTDSINDLPLCLKAAHTYAVNPNPRLLLKAQEYNWPVLDWRKEKQLQSVKVY